MKTVKELENKLKEFNQTSLAIYKDYPTIKNVDFPAIESIPLKTMIAFAKKHNLKPEYQTWSNNIRLMFYCFSNPFGKFHVELSTVKVERVIPLNPPVLETEFREVKAK